MENEMRYFELNTGAKIPSIGLGTYCTPPPIVAAAIKLGYRHIDCAHIYGNEKEIGQTLKQLFDEGKVKREDLFTTSKLWNYDHEPEDVPKALARTLDNLQLDYLDLYLIHWPVKEKKGRVNNTWERYLSPDLPSTWKAMEALYDSGKVRAIGVSNFSAKKLQDLLKVARIPPAANQVECHPKWQQQNLHDFCKSKGIHLSGYPPLGSQGIEEKKSGVLVDHILNMVAEKLGKSPAQVALRWGLQMGHSVLPKTSNEVKFLKLEDVVHESSDGYKTLEELWDEQV